MGKLTLNNLHLHLHWLSIGWAALILAALPCVCQGQRQEGFGRSPRLTRDCLDCLFPNLEQLKKKYFKLKFEFEHKRWKGFKRKNKIWANTGNSQKEKSLLFLEVGKGGGGKFNSWLIFSKSLPSIKPFLAQGRGGASKPEIGLS